VGVMSETDDLGVPEYNKDGDNYYFTREELEYMKSIWEAEAKLESVKQYKAYIKSQSPLQRQINRIKS
jgi:uncharacterized protein (UPF0216 family)